MKTVLLLQLPIPQQNFGMRTGNIPLAAATLKQSAESVSGYHVTIFSEQLATYVGDSALIKQILEIKPDILGFTVFNWNLHRSLYIAKKIKETYQPQIIFGGPEITPDNPHLTSPDINFLVFGEGEAAFVRLLTEKDFWEEKTCHFSSERFFQTAGSPYLKGYLDIKTNNIMYMESQRGCPYRCGFCFYNKSQKKTSFIHDDFVINALKWGMENRVEEFCFIDPSLNIRPGLKSLLKQIAQINDGSVSLTGETRADAIDEETADLFKTAGFTGFEIGLQSTNEKALTIMNRKTDIDRFLKGTFWLKERDILPRIDLIVGLPGDTPEGFKKSVDFISENDLAYDVQVFPLSVLPGTDFRKNFEKLGVVFDHMPPYMIQETSTFSEEEMLMAFDYAEQMFDVSLFPAADIDLSFRSEHHDACRTDHTTTIAGRKFITKLFLYPDRPLSQIEHLAEAVAHPYQIIIPKATKDISFIKKATEIISKKNPFTPFEMVFHLPDALPKVSELLSAINLFRPNYLDNDLRFVYGDPGNRSVLFSLLTDNREILFEGEMKRQVYWWKNPELPGPKELETLWELDGILIDTKLPADVVCTWMEEIAPYSEELIHITFADTVLQKEWMKRTASDEYVFQLL